MVVVEISISCQQGGRAKAFFNVEIVLSRKLLRRDTDITGGPG